MRMIGPPINLEFLEHLAPQPVLGQHAFDRQTQYLLRLVRQHLLGWGQLYPSHVARMAPIDLLV